MYKSWTGGAWWSLKFFNSYTFYGVSEDLYLLHTLHHYLIERDWCWRRWRRLGNNGSTWWGLRRLTRMSANPCSWTWGGLAMTRQQHSPMPGLVPPLIFSTFSWAAHVFGENPVPRKVMSKQGLRRVGMISENIMGSTSSRSPASWTISCQHHHHSHPIPS